MKKDRQENRNVPNLRFREFGGSWEEKKLGDIGSFYYGKSAPKHSLSDTATTPCVRYGELYTKFDGIITQIYSFTEIPRDNLKFSKGGEILIPRVGEDPMSFSKCSHLTLKNVAIGEMISVYNTGQYQPFMVAYIRAKLKKSFARVVEGGNVSNLYFRYLEGINIKLPTLTEQRRIGDFLLLINKRIETQNKILKDYKLFKKGLMQKIFKQEIRLKDEQGNSYSQWQEEKLGTLTKKVGKKNKENINYPIYSINNKEGFLPQSDQFEGMNSNSRGYDISLYKIIQKNTFAYNPARINVGSIGFSGDLENIIISSLYVCFKTTESLDDNYLLQYLDSFEFNKSVLRNVEGGVREYLFYENFSAIKIPLPCIEEQQKIASTLSAIDDKITLEINYLEQLKKQKQYLLQNMFI